jgi:hypothetical protein
MSGTNGPYLAYTIPLIAGQQQFRINLNGTAYQMIVTYREVDAQVSNWTLELLSSAGVSITGVIPLVTGIDLLGQLAYLAFGFGLYVASSGVDILAMPTYANLGSIAQLLYVPYP